MPISMAIQPSPAFPSTTLKPTSTSSSKPSSSTSQPLPLLSLPTEVLEQIALYLPTLLPISHTHRLLRLIIHHPSTQRKWVRRWFTKHHAGSWEVLFRANETVWKRLADGTSSVPFGATDECGSVNRFAVRDAVKEGMGMWEGDVIATLGCVRGMLRSLLAVAPYTPASEGRDADAEVGDVGAALTEREFWKRVAMFASYFGQVEAVDVALNALARLPAVIPSEDAAKGQPKSEDFASVLARALHCAVLGGAKPTVMYLRTRHNAVLSLSDHSATGDDTDTLMTWCQDLEEIVMDEIGESMMADEVTSAEMLAQERRNKGRADSLTCFVDALDEANRAEATDKLICAGMGNEAVLSVLLRRGAVGGDVHQAAIAHLVERYLPAWNCQSGVPPPQVPPTHVLNALLHGAVRAGNEKLVMALAPVADRTHILIAALRIAVTSNFNAATDMDPDHANLAITQTLLQRLPSVLFTPFTSSSPPAYGLHTTAHALKDLLELILLTARPDVVSHLSDARHISLSHPSASPIVSSLLVSAVLHTNPTQPVSLSPLGELRPSDIPSMVTRSSISLSSPRNTTRHIARVFAGLDALHTGLRMDVGRDARQALVLAAEFGNRAAVKWMLERDGQGVLKETSEKAYARAVEAVGKGRIGDDVLREFWERGVGGGVETA
ncbi:uncharacterized protein EV422DRAFT_568423 [Fimicolochytrium jonesii]|uniref:uncharacterized protein n=1 Tax=Fimicolochytrium jonesii TaxID=1396493 RepID=UPI0022FE297B|nr:uncharacterized protein EV422DRAFT_568423 [Fimicolochytrium jonesii]KAI8819978.1 hypothetical protein EV422DRAFT_568423 [Fimicolochytrium jonesii]